MKPAFLTRPEAWTRASRGASDPVGYACAVQRQAEAAPWSWRDFVAAVVCGVALVCVAFVGAA
jgi:uncharacterized protein (DUF1800 family)